MELRGYSQWNLGGRECFCLEADLVFFEFELWCITLLLKIFFDVFLFGKHYFNV
jgi:hypothetical protein